MINTIPLTQFIQQIKSAELSNQKEIKVSITQARLINIALNELLLSLNQDYEILFQKIINHQENQTVTINMDGGTF